MQITRGYTRMAALLVILANSVWSQTCDFAEETVPIKQPDGSFVCECDRQKGYIGPAEYACAYVECPEHSLPDDDATCQCIEEYFKRDGNCIEKTRCKPDETILHNGSRYDDRKCIKTVAVHIRHTPLVVVSDIKSTSVSLEVFRNANENGAQNVSLIFNHLEDVQQRRVINTRIGGTEPKVSAIIPGLASNTSYQVEVTISDQGGTSDPVTFVLHTEPQIVRSRAAPIVKVLAVDKTSCTLEVTPDQELDSGIIALTFRNLTDNREGHMEKEIERGKPVTLMTVTGLTASTSYHFDVKTDDVAGLSDARQFHVQTDPDLRPNMPNHEENSTTLVTVIIIAAVVGTFVIVAGVWKWRSSRNKSGSSIQETGDDSSPPPTADLLKEGLQAQRPADSLDPDQVAVKEPFVCHPEEEIRVA